ncbi:hypothetical protein HMPREF3213_03269 [Heyndrickxia coagulans]|uniref:Uncharacterized protein n=1 Tax=Heyndrickxia coagulans TaxID=1398 RepID=A0A133KCU7_HEYCO|nr:hypothetical protein HMPREF3213_03269 [Heyndrickxia coagulans]
MFPSMKIPPEQPFSYNLTFPNSAVKNKTIKFFRILAFNLHWIRMKSETITRYANAL